MYITQLDQNGKTTLVKYYGKENTIQPPSNIDIIDNHAFSHVSHKCTLRIPKRLQQQLKPSKLPNNIKIEIIALKDTDSLSHHFTELEKKQYNHIIIEDNIVHLLIPLTSGHTIGLDNTCQTGIELKNFFGFNRDLNTISAQVSLLQLRADLIADIRKLETIPNQEKKIIEKKEKLSQVKQYLTALHDLLYLDRYIYNNDNAKSMNSMYPELPRGLKQLLKPNKNQEHINLLSMHLRPKIPDLYCQYTPVFSLPRPITINGRTTSEQSSEFLTYCEEKFSELKKLDQLPWITHLESQAQSIEQVNYATVKLKHPLLYVKKRALQILDPSFQAHNDASLQHVISTLNQIMTEFETDTPWEFNTASNDLRHITYNTLLNELYLIGENSRLNEVIDAIINTATSSASDSPWKTLPHDPFFAYYQKSDPNFGHTLSFLTQFLIAHINLFCANEGLSHENLGQYFESNQDEIEDLIDGICDNLKSGNLVYDNVFSQIKTISLPELSIATPFTTTEKNSIIALFKKNVNTVIDAQHKDEFTLLFNNETGIAHHFQGRICVPFYSYFNHALDAYKTTIKTTLSKNPKQIPDSVYLHSLSAPDTLKLDNYTRPSPQIFNNIKQTQNSVDKTSLKNLLDRHIQSDPQLSESHSDQSGVAPDPQIVELVLEQYPSSVRLLPENNPSTQRFILKYHERFPAILQYASRNLILKSGILKSRLWLLPHCPPCILSDTNLLINLINSSSQPYPLSSLPEPTILSIIHYLDNNSTPSDSNFKKHLKTILEILKKSQIKPNMDILLALFDSVQRIEPSFGSTLTSEENHCADSILTDLIESKFDITSVHILVEYFPRFYRVLPSQFKQLPDVIFKRINAIQPQCFTHLLKTTLNQGETLVNKGESSSSLLDAFTLPDPDHQQKHDTFFMLPDNVKNDLHFANNIIANSSRKGLNLVLFSEATRSETSIMINATHSLDPSKSILIWHLIPSKNRCRPKTIISILQAIEQQHLQALVTHPTFNLKLILSCIVKDKYPIPPPIFKKILTALPCADTIDHDTLASIICNNDSLLAVILTRPEFINEAFIQKIIKLNEGFFQLALDRSSISIHQCAILLALHPTLASHIIINQSQIQDNTIACQYLSSLFYPTQTIPFIKTKTNDAKRSITTDRHQTERASLGKRQRSNQSTTPKKRRAVRNKQSDSTLAFLRQQLLTMRDSNTREYDNTSTNLPTQQSQTSRL